VFQAKEHIKGHLLCKEFLQKTNLYCINVRLAKNRENLKNHTQWKML